MEKIIKIVLPLLAVFGVTFIVASGLTRDPASISGRTAKELQAAGEEAESNRVKLSIAGGETEAAEDGGEAGSVGDADTADNAEASGNGSGSSAQSDPADPQADASSVPENSDPANSESAAPAEVSDVEIPSGQVAPVTEIAPYSGGTPVQIEDEELAACIRKQAGLDEDEPITDTLCQSIIKLDARGYQPRTLYDLSYLDNLEWFFLEYDYRDDGRHNHDLDLTGLEEVPKLKVFSIKDCSVMDRSPVEKLTQLEYLEWNIGMEDMELLTHLPNLETVYIESYGYTIDLTGIEKLTKLKRLALINSVLPDITPLSNMTQLEYLDIHSDMGQIGFSDYSPLAALKNLKYLDISWSEFDYAKKMYDQPVSDGSFLNSLTNLMELKLINHGMENYSLSSLSNLRRLTIDNYVLEASDVIAQLDESGAIGKLQYLDLVSLTAEELEFLTRKAINLEGLDSALKTVNISSLEDMKKLKHLSICISIMGEEIQKSESMASVEEKLEKVYQRLGNMTNLEELEISFFINPFEKYGPDGYSFLNNLVNLKRLSVEGYNGMDISCFSNLKALESLTISYVDCLDVEPLKQFPELKEFNYYKVGEFENEEVFNTLDIPVTELSSI